MSKILEYLTTNKLNILSLVASVVVAGLTVVANGGDFSQGVKIAFGTKEAQIQACADLFNGTVLTEK